MAVPPMPAAPVSGTVPGIAGSPGVVGGVTVGSSPGGGVCGLIGPPKGVPQVSEGLEAGVPAQLSALVPTPFSSPAKKPPQSRSA